MSNVTIEKGSITINGTSLTVVNSKLNEFSVAIIPYTYENTIFSTLKIGDAVNLEFDVIGKEDEEIIKPALKKIYDSGVLVFGPYSADSFFGSNQYKQYDAVLAVYHDQGLIPFKTMSFGNGVNYTAGLSKIRTSPDHGTAFDIAGKNKANESSFREALYLAIDVYNNRNEYKELTNNPLIASK